MGCVLCPRRCGDSFCGREPETKIARAALHFWEEPCISGKNGSGTVFFSGCQLKCVFCQNYNISRDNFGKSISTNRLAEIFFELESSGAHNINLVSGTQYVPQIIAALKIAQPKVPVVFNSGGYETEETLELLREYVDIFLPDFKYADPELAKKYSRAQDYPEVAKKAILKMQSITGKPVFSDDGLLLRGTVVRHLLMPSHVSNSVAVIDALTSMFEPNDILISLMSQYYPTAACADYPEINRQITSREYFRVMKAVKNSGFEGYFQGLSSAKEKYTPPFDLEGV